MLRTALWSARVGGLLLLLSPHASAQTSGATPREAARTLGLAGVESYQQANYDEASTKLEQAYRLLQVPSLGLWSARALVKRDRLVDAAERYLETTSLQIPQGEASVQRQAQVEAQTELDALRPRIPRLVVRLVGAAASDVTFVIDGKPVAASVIGTPRLLDPGRHEVVVQRGSERKSKTVSLAAGEEEVLEIVFSSPGSSGRAPGGSVGEPGMIPAPAEDPGARDAGQAGSTRRTLGWAVLAGGGVAGLVGGVAGLMVLSKRASLEGSGVCVETRCPSSKRSEVESLQTFRTLSSIGLIAGGVLGATGIVLVLTAPSDKAQIAAAVSFQTLGVRGTFQ